MINILSVPEDCILIIKNFLFDYNITKLKLENYFDNLYEQQIEIIFNKFSKSINSFSLSTSRIDCLKEMLFFSDYYNFCYVISDKEAIKIMNYLKYFNFNLNLLDITKKSSLLIPLYSNPYYVPYNFLYLSTSSSLEFIF